MPEGLRLALTTLTVAPLRRPGRLDRRTAGQAMALAPAVGLLLGLLAAALLLLARAVTDPPLAVALTVALLAALTRGLHLDGLADTADGLGSLLPPEAARRVMKQPDIGALGLVAVLLVLAVQGTALLASVAHGRGTAAVLLAVATSRAAVTAACAGRPPAAGEGAGEGPDGEGPGGAGLGALFAGTVPRWVPAAWAAGLAGAGAVAGFLDEAAGPAGALRAAAAVAAGLLAARLLRRHAARRLGAVSGDVLGALVEVSTAVVLVVLALG